VLVGCGAEADRMRGGVKPDDVRPSTRADADSLAESLRKLALPQGPISAPMMVVAGSKDEVVPQAWITSSVSRSCQLGGQIDFVVEEGVGHGGVGPNEQVITWIGDRLANKPATTNCAAS
jgi:hypothetical protein